MLRSFTIAPFCLLNQSTHVLPIETVLPKPRSLTVSATGKASVKMKNQAKIEKKGVDTFTSESKSRVVEPGLRGVRYWKREDKGGNWIWIKK